VLPGPGPPGRDTRVWCARCMGSRANFQPGTVPRLSPASAAADASACCSCSAHPQACAVGAPDRRAALGLDQGVQPRNHQAAAAFLHLGRLREPPPGPQAARSSSARKPDLGAGVSIWACCSSSTRLQPGPRSLMARRANGSVLRQPEAQQIWVRVVSCRWPRPIPTAAGTIGGEAPNSRAQAAIQGRDPWGVVNSARRQTRRHLPKGCGMTAGQLQPPQELAKQAGRGPGSRTMASPAAANRSGRFKRRNAASSAGPPPHHNGIHPPPLRGKMNRTPRHGRGRRLGPRQTTPNHLEQPAASGVGSIGPSLIRWRSQARFAAGGCASAARSVRRETAAAHHCAPASHAQAVAASNPRAGQRASTTEWGRPKSNRAAQHHVPATAGGATSRPGPGLAHQAAGLRPAVARRGSRAVVHAAGATKLLNFPRARLCFQLGCGHIQIPTILHSRRAGPCHRPPPLELH